MTALAIVVAILLLLNEVAGATNANLIRRLYRDMPPGAVLVRVTASAAVYVLVIALLIERL